MRQSNESRRSMIKKASFVAPAILTFKLSEMKAYASSGVSVGNGVNGGNHGNNGNNGGNGGNNGNHYGNSRPDQNPRDNKNPHNTAH